MRTYIYPTSRATIIDMTFTSMARMNIEVGDRIIRNVVIGPSGEAILPPGISLTLGQHVEIEQIAQARYLGVLGDLFGTQRQRRVSAE
jgi:hypothetical protein